MVGVGSACRRMNKVQSCGMRWVNNFRRSKLLNKGKLLLCWQRAPVTARRHDKYHQGIQECLWCPTLLPVHAYRIGVRC